MTSDPLGPLRVIDRMEIGPPDLRPGTVVIPHRVIAGRRSDARDLVFKYAEDVFDPGDASCVNLASMIGAQVALNYGLFCREIVFKGIYDASDRKFIEEAMRNTAREILVKKILEPNPFLLEEARGLPAVKHEQMASRISFEGPQEVGAEGSWRSSTARHAVLSSGGKDSLLSYGLLAEAGREVHPLFVNESGRHWYTALNAFRHFEAGIPGTSRVWTTSDRMFSWMLGHLPFIRKDFARIRSDEYPIRLWTVAVFIFGVLPLVRKRGIGRIVIGDEFDTTVRASHKGIPHYDGLYDQSRTFDNMMSRYFSRKGWRISQFSILRNLSELLIQKTLIERFPRLQAHQTSCHAAHLQEGRVHPCGRCEKCRRIVGMIVSVGGDPGACGYSEGQVRDVLSSIGTLGVHQEGPGAEHLMHALAERGSVPASTPLARGARPHPEIMCLRFDRARSPVDTFPPDLRSAVYGALLEHARGAVRRSGRVWLEFDPLSTDSLTAPYRFEAASRKWKTGGAARSGAEGNLLADMTWIEVRQRLRDVDVALFPVGATEQHGPHLPLDVDVFDVAWLCDQVAASCSAPRPVVLPAIPYGVSYHHDDFPGTMSVSPETLARFVYEVGMSAAKHGVSKLVIVNGHGGNSPALQFAAQMINRDARIFTCVDSGESSDAEVDGIAETPNDVHAGEIETSTTLALRPDAVRMHLARPSVPSFSSEYLNFSSTKGVAWFARTKRISRRGVLGDPTRATAEKGRLMWDRIVGNLVKLVEDLKDLSLDEIHERRY